MARGLFRTGVRTTNTTINTAAFEIIAPARRIGIRMIKAVNAAATAQSIGIGRPAAAGITPTSVLFTKDDPADETVDVNGAIAWVTKPTSPTIYLERTNFAATIGVGMIWQFDDKTEIIIAASGTFTVDLATAGAVMDISAAVRP